MKKVLILSGSPRKGGIYGTGVYQPGDCPFLPLLSINIIKNKN